MNQPDAKHAQKNRLILLLLFMIFLAPAVGSWLLYENVDRLHLGTTNHGEFVQPPRAVNAAGLALPQDYFAHRFTLAYFSGAGCGDACREALQVMRGTQIALGEHAKDVQRLYLAAGTPDTAVVQMDPALKVLNASGEPVLKAFDGADSAKYIYLISPQGYVVLRYPLSGDPKWLLQDLRHLLGASEG